MPTTTRVRRARSSTRSARCCSGVTFVGPDVGEMIQAATIAIVGEVPLVTALARGAGLSDGERGVAAVPRDLRPRGVRVKALPDIEPATRTRAERFFATIDRGVRRVPSLRASCSGRS